MNEISQRRSLFQRWVLDPVVKQLSQGISASKIALAIAFGITLGIFPIMGTPTLLTCAVGIPLKLNQPILQIFKELVYPLHLLLIVFFLKAGQLLFGQNQSDFSIKLMTQQATDNFGKFLNNFGTLALQAVVVWLIMAPILIGIIYFITRLIIVRFQRKQI
jgi:uncharacterized protein (DUF2062 family)